MGRTRQSKVARLDAASTAVGNTTLSETTNAGLVVGSPVTRASKPKAGKNLPESSNPSKGKAIMEKISVEEQLVENLGSNPSIVEKIDFLVHSAQEFSSKGIKQPFGKGDKALELNYKSQYLESQKKVEALTKENKELSVKLASTHSKLEAYEAMNALGQMKEMMFATNVAKATEAFVKFTSQLPSGEGGALSAAAATGEGTINPAVAAQQTASLPQATTTGQGTTSTVSAEPGAPLLQAATGEGTNPAVAAEQTASLPQATTTGQGTSSTFCAELELGRSKRTVKKKVRWFLGIDGRYV